MANKINNDKDHPGHTSGFGTVEDIVPTNPPPDPGGKPHNSGLGDWIRRDAEFKERGTILKKYS
jgi:hypothetical protein